VANSGRQDDVVRTEGQREIVRNRLNEYRNLRGVGTRKPSWRRIGDEIYDRTEVHVRSEVVRKWVEQFKEQNRKTPVRTNAEELEAIISYLIKVRMLLPEELKNPEAPNLFLHSLLKHLQHNRTSVSPAALDGVYEAWHQVEATDQNEEIWIRAKLELKIDPDTRFVRAIETLETHVREADETEVLSDGRTNEGWGVITPEGNILLFMKTPDRHNYLLFDNGSQLSTDDCPCLASISSVAASAACEGRSYLRKSDRPDTSNKRWYTSPQF
jgi:hypothetical protein